MPRRNAIHPAGQAFLEGMTPPQQEIPLVTKTATTPTSIRVAVPKPGTDWLPPNCGKALKLPTVDFNDPNRPKTCLEVDFPILPVNRLAQIEGNAGKPIYQMSKWWARRRSSVFRTLLIAGATKAPDEQRQAGKLVWDAYYANHQKAGSFSNLRVLEPFMGGGTTLVEGARLGFQLAGCDLNPIAWLVCKNELAASDPAKVQDLFAHIEQEVKPQIQPFYTTTCPRGHRGRWVDRSTGQEAPNIDPIRLPPSDRVGFRWDGPEIIYTFWVKHGHCRKEECQHRTPMMGSPVIATKELSASYLPTTCRHCGHEFRVFMGETRMAPGCQRVNASGEPSYTETSRRFADLIGKYGKESVDEALLTAQAVVAGIPDETAFNCPSCHQPAGDGLLATVRDQLVPRASGRGGRSRVSKAALDRKKLGLQKATVAMTLCMDPRWLKGGPGQRGDLVAGGLAVSTPAANESWYESRLENCRFVELRGDVTTEPSLILADGSALNLGLGNIPKDAHFTCQACGLTQKALDATTTLHSTAPIMPYALQCHCPQCASEGQEYSGRFFKTVDEADFVRLVAAEREWQQRSDADLTNYWPREEIAVAYMTHVRQPLPQHGYTHWRMMFNPRQLLTHALLLKTITEADPANYPLDIREQALGAFQQYLRNQNLFCFYDGGYDKLCPALSNNNFHPKALPLENSVFGALGRGNWLSCAAGVVEGISWRSQVWEAALNLQGESVRCETGDQLPSGSTHLLCGSSTELSSFGDVPFDLIVTDPPFGKNLYYADLADFFYVWLRIPLARWYVGTPQVQPWLAARTPHAAEAVPNPIETPDDREEWQTKPLITRKHLDVIREKIGNPDLESGQLNPCFVEEPCDRRYREMLTEVWAECFRRLKPGGLMAFTFHHSEDDPWIDVLQALFDAGFVLVATYPVRSDETKGANAAFGAKKIEYDIVHVCRKRLEQPEPVAYLKMRSWVKEEAAQLKRLLDDSHQGYGAEGLPDNDLRIILIGKCLEFYSRHYGQVLTGTSQVLGVRDALLGVNQLIDDLLATDSGGTAPRPPDEAEPPTRLYLKLFGLTPVMEKNDCFKAMKGTGYDISDLEGLGWAVLNSGEARRVSMPDRFTYLKTRNRKVLKRDLDQAMFLAGCCLLTNKTDVTAELDAGRANHSWTPKRGVLAILTWMSLHDPEGSTQVAARTAATLLEAWLARAPGTEDSRQLSIFEKLEQQASGGIS